MGKVKVGFEIKEEDYPSWVKFKGYVLLKYGTIRGKLGEEIMDLVNRKLDSLKENKEDQKEKVPH
jgi:hypothetical protein